jgi:Flp pilus assembly protein TadB
MRGNAVANNDIQDDAKARWQRQQPETNAMSIDEVRDRAQRFQQKTRTENVFQYAVLVGVSVWLGASILILKPVMIIQVSLGLLAAGAVVIGYQLHRRRNTRRLPQELGLLPSIEFHRRELERELNAQLNLSLWYGLPVVPGLSVLIVAVALAPSGRGVVPAALVAAGFAAVFMFTSRANRRKVRQLRSQIEELLA